MKLWTAGDPREAVVRRISQIPLGKYQCDGAKDACGISPCREGLGPGGCERLPEEM